ncbi:beta-lactamase family protein [Candidatus Woesebacteria bacterium]|nr:MAG: beta-lactamase family protein [Candidatus Woesebacteria bacterium]
MKQPGYALIISRNGQTLYQQYEGYADIENNQIISRSTKFRLASLTKPFTAMLILKLIDDKLVKLDDTLNRFFPELPNWKYKVSVENLLNHTSGIKDYEKILAKNKYKKGSEPTNQEAISVISCFDKLIFKPSQMQVYSESGYVLLAEIIKRVGGSSYSKQLNTIIFQPMKMDNTLVYENSTAVFDNRAMGYRFAKGKYTIYDYNPLNYVIGNEGVYSSAQDLGKWTSAWFSEKIISSYLIDKSFSKTQLLSGTIADRGYSFILDKYGSDKIVYHGGSWVGFRCMLVLIPSQKLSGVFLSNSTDYDKETKRLIMLINNLSKFSNAI